MATMKETSRYNVAAMARQHAGKAIEKLASLIDHADPRVAADASRAVLERAIGKPIAMTADMTNRLSELDDSTIDAAIAAAELLQSVIAPPAGPVAGAAPPKGSPESR